MEVSRAANRSRIRQHSPVQFCHVLSRWTSRHGDWFCPIVASAEKRRYRPHRQKSDRWRPKRIKTQITNGNRRKQKRNESRSHGASVLLPPSQNAQAHWVVYRHIYVYHHIYWHHHYWHHGYWSGGYWRPGRGMLIHAALALLSVCRIADLYGAGPIRESS